MLSYKKSLGVIVRHANWSDYSTLRKAHADHLPAREFSCDCLTIAKLIETRLLHQGGHLNTRKARQQRYDDRMSGITRECNERATALAQKRAAHLKNKNA